MTEVIGNYRVSTSAVPAAHHGSRTGRARPRADEPSIPGGSPDVGGIGGSVIDPIGRASPLGRKPQDRARIRSASTGVSTGCERYVIRFESCRASEPRAEIVAVPDRSWRADPHRGVRCRQGRRDSRLRPGFQLEDTLGDRPRRRCPGNSYSKLDTIGYVRLSCTCCIIFIIRYDRGSNPDRRPVIRSLRETKRWGW